jgi:hypothetical protein
MERELWTALYQLARRLSSDRRGHVYCVSWIVGVYLWSVVHDRPVSWACQSENWPTEWRVRLPHQSTMSRRLKSAAAVALLAALQERLCRCKASQNVCLIDGKPLLVGVFSKDPDAAKGHVPGGWARGYKLHALWSDGPLPVSHEIQPLNVSEQSVARRLLRSVHGGFVLGDGNYDSNQLHEVAAEGGVQLVAPQRQPGRALGHRRHAAGRLRALELLQSDAGRRLFKRRTHIERQFGQLTNFGGGLAPLPNWVRRLVRVRLWVQAKLIIHVARNHLRQRQDLMTIA